MLAVANMDEIPRVVGFGEVMLRLKPPAHERLLQSPQLEARFGGSEFNVLASLSQFGVPTSLVGAVPDNELGSACLTDVRARAVATEHMLISGERLGLYFLEAGAGHRPSNVVYDRDGSAFSKLRAEDIEWDLVFENCSWFHLSGITPALSASLAKLSLAAIAKAKTANIPVSFDFNYRQKLWAQNHLSAKSIFSEIVKSVDVLLASEHDCASCLDIVNEDTTLDPASSYFTMTERMFDAFPNLSVMASTFRQRISADHNNLTAGLRNRDGYFMSQTYEMTDIIDRIGGGDAFAAGLIYGLLKQGKGQKVIDFAAAAACLKHTVPGDVNRVNVFEVEELMRGRSGGNVNR